MVTNSKNTDRIVSAAMFELKLKRKFSFMAPVNDYIKRYSSWLVRLVEDCQASGVIQRSGFGLKAKNNPVRQRSLAARRGLVP